MKTKFDFSVFGEKLNTLTPVERRLLNMMLAGDVPFLKGKPGVGKTALYESIAQKLDIIYRSFPIPTMDESDMGVMPKVIDANSASNPFGIDYVSHPKPLWAIEPSKNLSTFFLYVFEEINRGRTEITDALLGILNEKTVGYDFKLTPNVLMGATGNIGTEDGADVNEMDTAKKSRLVTIPFDQKYHEWTVNYGNKNVHPMVISFLDANSKYFYPNINDQKKNDVIVNPRQWTKFGNYLLTVYGADCEFDIEMEMDLIEVSSRYLGNIGMEFINFHKNNRSITLEQLLKAKKEIVWEKVQRANKSRIIEEIEKAELDVKKLTKTATKNLYNFIDSVDADEQMVAIEKLLNATNESDDCPEAYTVFWTRYIDQIRTILTAMGITPEQIVQGKEEIAKVEALEAENAK